MKMQWLPLILNGKSTDKALFCLYEEIDFICVIYLGLVLKLKFTCYLFLHFVI